MLNKSVLIINPTGGSPYHGPNMRSYNLAKNLIAKGCHVTIVANAFFHKFHKFPKTDGLFTKQDIDGVPYIWVKTKSYKSRGVNQVLNQLQFAFIVYRYIKKLNLKNIDCVICSSPPPFAIVAANKTAKKYKAKLIFEIRDLWPEVIQELSGVSSYNPYIQLLKHTAKFAYKKADYIVSVKKGEIEILDKKYKVPHAKFKYIPNGYDLKSLEANNSLPNGIQNIFSNLNDKFIVSYVGSLSVAYDIGYLIKAAHQLKKNKDVVFVIVGDGPEEKSLKEYCKLNDLKNIVFLGRVSSKHIQQILKNVSVGFLGYKKAEWLKYGVSSNKIFDYMACKLPIIASLETQYNPIIEANCGISVNPGSEKALADAIIQIKNKPYDELRDLGLNGYEYLCKYHSFKHIASQYYELMNH